MGRLFQRAPARVSEDCAAIAGLPLSLAHLVWRGHLWTGGAQGEPEKAAGWHLLQDLYPLQSPLEKAPYVAPKPWQEDETEVADVRQQPCRSGGGEERGRKEEKKQRQKSSVLGGMGVKSSGLGGTGGRRGESGNRKVEAWEEYGWRGGSLGGTGGRRGGSVEKQRRKEGGKKKSGCQI